MVEVFVVSKSLTSDLVQIYRIRAFIRTKWIIRCPLFNVHQILWKSYSLIFRRFYERVNYGFHGNKRSPLSQVTVRKFQSPLIRSMFLYFGSILKLGSLWLVPLPLFQWRCLYYVTEIFKHGYFDCCQFYSNVRIQFICIQYLSETWLTLKKHCHPVVFVGKSFTQRVLIFVITI